MNLHPARLALALLALPFTFSAQVIVVDDDGGPGVDYTSLYQAVIAAVEGDTVLVREGTYTSVFLVRKSLQVVADTGAVVLINGVFSIESLFPTQSVLVHGVRVQSSMGGSALQVFNCAGPVWIEDAQLVGPPPSTFEGSGALVLDSKAVTLLRCELTGGGQFGLVPGDGLTSSGSNVAFFDTLAHGAPGGTGTPLGGPGMPPGAGARVIDGELFASGGALVGGVGTNGLSPLGCVDGGPGGPGLQLQGTGLAVLQGFTPAGGPGGPAGAPCVAGVQGPSYDAAPGTFTELAEPARHLAVAGPLHAGQVGSLVAEGQPGELVFLLLASSQAPLQLATPLLLGGPLLPSLAGLVLTLGTTDGLGVLQLQVVPGAPPAGLASTLYAQAVFLDPLAGPPAVVGPGQALTLLGAGL